MHEEYPPCRSPHGGVTIPTTLHYTALYYTTLHCTKTNYNTTLHCNLVHSTLCPGYTVYYLIIPTLTNQQLAATVPWPVASSTKT